MLALTAFPFLHAMAFGTALVLTRLGARSGAARMDLALRGINGLSTLLGELERERGTVTLFLAGGLRAAERDDRLKRTKAAMES